MIPTYLYHNTGKKLFAKNGEKAHFFLTHSCRLIELNSLDFVFGRVSIGGKAGQDESTQENADEILEEDLQAGLKGVKLYPVNHLFHVNDPEAEKIYPVTVNTGSYS